MNHKHVTPYGVAEVGGPRTLAANRWRGVMATRSGLDLENPELVAVPTSLLDWLIGG